ncbi:MAG: hypothetical protein M3347_09970, partial [Armatimonadota bacterium]|nr:hypothetical protein [Armatimonadota bacterium]
MFILVIFLWFPRPHGACGAATIRISNLSTNTSLRYPVALLKGQVDLADGSPLVVMNESSARPSRLFRTRVLRGRFKALAELVPGNNQLKVQCAGGEMQLTLRYEPMTTPQVVRVIFVTDPGGRTEYITQKENDPQDFRAKISTAVKLLQTATAESLHDLGLGRKTFRLELDQDGEVIVHIFKTPNPASYYQAMSDDQIPYEMRRLVEPHFPTDRARNLVIMGVTGYDPVAKRALGHTAFATGNAAVFSALGMFSWPSSLQEVQDAFSDTTRVDPSRVANDSAGRSTFWGLAATTIGVMLHELAHTFAGLPHSPDGYSIMSRGFDHFNRVFTVVEPPSAQNSQPVSFRDDEVARFDRTSAGRLAYCRLFEMDARTYTNHPPPVAVVDPATANIIVSAPAGLRTAGLDRDDLSRDTAIYPEVPPQRVEYSFPQLSRLAGGDNF